MIDDKNEPAGQDSFDLEIEDEPDTDEIMREAMHAVKSHHAEEVGIAEAEVVSEEKVEDDLVEDANLPSTGDASSVAVLEAQLAEAEERKIRALADYENFRRRVDRERRDFARYAAENALTEFLPVLDNLGRALQAEGDVEDLKSGIEMIHSQVVEMLARLHVLPVPSIGERFDPSVHEAVAKEESSEVQLPTILDEYQTGYVLHDRLLRPAMVRVAMPMDRHEPVESGDTGNDGTDSVGTEDQARGEEEQ